MSTLEQQIQIGEKIAEDMVLPWTPYDWSDADCQRCGKKTVFRCENEGTGCAHCDFYPDVNFDLSEGYGWC